MTDEPGVAHDDDAVEYVLGPERRICVFGPVARRQRPDELLVTEVGWHPDAKHESIAPRREVARLTLVRPPGLQVVVRSDRDVEELVPVAVHVPEDQVVASVRIRFPTLVGRCNRLTAVVDDSATRDLTADRAIDDQQGQHDEDGRHAEPSEPFVGSWHPTDLVEPGDADGRGGVASG